MNAHRNVWTKNMIMRSVATWPSFIEMEIYTGTVETMISNVRWKVDLKHCIIFAIWIFTMMFLTSECFVFTDIVQCVSLRSHYMTIIYLGRRQPTVAFSQEFWSHLAFFWLLLYKVQKFPRCEFLWNIFSLSRRVNKWLSIGEENVVCLLPFIYCCTYGLASNDAIFN